ncbi:MFS transporter [Photobacterium sp. CAU 1568]|uniref:MFS transporter n=1 Tax=Photobacterium arenosum TaxID=2774143 RepID=A0ABR9BG55_9GAMM|nr:MFS transporter [Photobacterium arenosum]MBD8511533.1 MFS transporter [Photobacterium arenosum]
MKAEISQAEKAENLSMTNWFSLLGLAVAVLLSSLNISIVNVALPRLASSFSVPMSEVQWLVVVYLLAMTCFMPIAGIWGDRFGRKRLFLFGIGLFFCGLIACIVSESLTQLIAARLVQGIGAAIFISLAMTFVSDFIPATKTGTAMGILGTTSAIGTALGPVLGGYLISHFDWHALFYVSVPFCIFALLLLARQLPDNAPVPFKLVKSGRFLAQFSENPALAGSLTANVCVSAIIMSTMVVSPFYFTDGLQLSPAQIGAILSVGPIVSALTGAPAGKLTDHLGSGTVVRVSLWIMLLGCLLISASAFWTSVPVYLFALILVTAGYAMFQAANNTAVMTEVKEGQKGVTSALLHFSRNLGLMAGASVMGWLYLFTSTFFPATQNQPATAFGVTFLISAILVGLAQVMVSLRKGR